MKSILPAPGLFSAWECRVKALGSSPLPRTVTRGSASSVCCASVSILSAQCTPYFRICFRLFLVPFLRADREEEEARSLHVAVAAGGCDAAAPRAPLLLAIPLFSRCCRVITAANQLGRHA